MDKKLAYQIVKRHIDDWDPIGLLALGVPEDEYDIEVMMIVEKFSIVFQMQDLAEEIQGVFDEMFYDGDGTMTTKDCHEVAFSIWQEVMTLLRKAENGRFKKGSRKKSKM